MKSFSENSCPSSNLLMALDIEKGLYNTPKGFTVTENLFSINFDPIFSEKQDPNNSIGERCVISKLAFGNNTGVCRFISLSLYYKFSINNSLRQYKMSWGFGHENRIVRGRFGLLPIKTKSAVVNLTFISIMAKFTLVYMTLPSWNSNLRWFICHSLRWSSNLRRWISHLSHENDSYHGVFDFHLMDGKSTAVNQIFMSWVPNLPQLIWFLPDKAVFCLTSATQMATNTSIYKKVGLLIKL